VSRIITLVQSRIPRRFGLDPIRDILVGQRKAVAIAVKNVSGRQRWSKLDEWLVEGEGT
jgi:hypothetical protein